MLKVALFLEDDHPEGLVHVAMLGRVAVRHAAEPPPLLARGGLYRPLAVVLVEHVVQCAIDPIKVLDDQLPPRLHLTDDPAQLAARVLLALVLPEAAREHHDGVVQLRADLRQLQKARGGIAAHDQHQVAGASVLQVGCDELSRRGERAQMRPLRLQVVIQDLQELRRRSRQAAEVASNRLGDRRIVEIDGAADGAHEIVKVTQAVKVCGGLVALPGSGVISRGLALGCV